MTASAHDRWRYGEILLGHAGLAAGLRVTRAKRAARGDGFRVGLMSPFYETAHGTYTRFAKWIPVLEGMGCQAELLTASTSEAYLGFQHGDSDADWRYCRECLRDQWRNLRRAAAYDVVVLHRGIFPLSTWQRPTFEKALFRQNRHIVYDFFDAIWLQRQDAGNERNSLRRWLNPPDKIECIMDLASVVTVSNEYLATWARQHHPDVRVIPMLVDVDDYELRVHEERRPVVIGWIGSRYQVPRLMSLAPALERLAATRDIVLRVVCTEPVAVPGVRMEYRTHPWSPDSDRRDFADLDIGVMVLEDTEYDRGKSPYKLLQYAAAGLPVVTTPVAVDLSVFEPGSKLLLAHDQEEWYASLLQLVDDVELRRRIGLAARETVDRLFSYKAYADAFVGALSAAADRPRPTALSV